ncbi:flagellar basal body rod protein FlgB [Curvibacter sp. APW13]|uniref:flagellar basal body rod protein FlgB n=1 Tax=Curvibacter sp. APW13 TaxID=3077236 RepID=UPI0028DF27A8|nr:flagellar basal body rod protein FlgB [Curvibacter sp. APW13]MDT8993039.1 flagellar basal body rod protein FlgB [Curvibacter sp. APW13]
MFAQLTQGLDFQSKALVVRAERQRLIASNIANVDTPGFKGHDIDFKAAMADALGEGRGIRPTPTETANTSGKTHAAHLPLQSRTGSTDTTLAYTVQSQPAMDGNSVDLDRERASFVDNAVRYEATLRFINGTSRTMLSAIQGQ